MLCSLKKMWVVLDLAKLTATVLGRCTICCCQDVTLELLGCSEWVWCIYMHLHLHFLHLTDAFMQINLQKRNITQVIHHKDSIIWSAAIKLCSLTMLSLQSGLWSSDAITMWLPKSTEPTPSLYYFPSRYTYTMLLFCKWFCCICLIKMKHYEIIQFKRNVFYVNIFLNAIYSCDGKAEFLASITPVFSVTWSFRNISSYYQCIKPLWCLIFCFCRNVQVLHCHFWSV